MTYLVEIENNNESKSLIEHLSTLKYVRIVANTKAENNSFIEKIKKSERSKRIDWNEAKKMILSWE